MPRDLTSVTLRAMCSSEHTMSQALAIVSSLHSSIVNFLGVQSKASQAPGNLAALPFIRHCGNNSRPPSSLQGCMVRSLYAAPQP